MRIGIYRFGLMGRLALRAGWDRLDLEFVLVNELACDPATCGHLLEFDSVHGRWPHRIAAVDGSLEIDGTRLPVSRSAEPGAVDWGDLGVDVVPFLNASLTDCVFEVEPATTAGEQRSLVFADDEDDARSSVIDDRSTMVIDGTQVKVLVCDDNEWATRTASSSSLRSWSLPPGRSHE